MSFPSLKDQQPPLIQSDLQLYIFSQYMCSLGIEPTTFCTADAMLYHWATQEHIIWKLNK